MQVELSAKELAELIKVSLARVGQLHKEGIITRLQNGKYPLEAIMQYFEFKLSKARVQGDVTGQIEQEKLRKLRRENDLEERKVAPVGILTDILSRASAIIVANLESLPLLIKRHWPEVTGDQITLVKKAVAECRNTIADMKIDLNE